MSTSVLSPMSREGSYAPVPLPSRLPDPSSYPISTNSRRKNITIALLSSVVVLCLLAVVAFHGYVAWMLAYPYVAPWTSNPMLAKNLEYTDIQFPSQSGKTTVHGWYIPAKESSVRTIVFSHRYGANREETWVPDRSAERAD